MWGNKWRKSAGSQRSNNVVNKWLLKSALDLASTKLMPQQTHACKTKNFQIKLYSLIGHNLIVMDDKRKAVPLSFQEYTVYTS